MYVPESNILCSCIDSRFRIIFSAAYIQTILLWITYD